MVTFSLAASNLKFSADLGEIHPPCKQWTSNAGFLDLLCCVFLKFSADLGYPTVDPIIFVIRSEPLSGTWPGLGMGSGPKTVGVGPGSGSPSGLDLVGLGLNSSRVRVQPRLEWIPDNVSIRVLN